MKNYLEFGKTYFKIIVPKLNETGSHGDDYPWFGRMKTDIFDPFGFGFEF
jgi:hypothetical protein